MKWDRVTTSLLRKQRISANATYLIFMQFSLSLLFSCENLEICVGVDFSRLMSLLMTTNSCSRRSSHLSKSCSNFSCVCKLCNIYIQIRGHQFRGRGMEEVAQNIHRGRSYTTFTGFWVFLTPSLPLVDRCWHLANPPPRLHWQKYLTEDQG